MIKISPNTRISELVKTNSASIEAIASLSKPLEKLKNPLLRKLLAARVNIAEAAKIGGCSLSDFKRVLEPLGFSLAIESPEEDTDTNATNLLPDWCVNNPVVKMDVRQGIAEGNDPLKEILTSYRQLQEGQVLCIINSFIPSPLISLLEKKGAQSFTHTIDQEEYHSYFLKKGINSKLQKETPSLSMMNLEEFEFLLDSYLPDDTVRLDVRELPMPQPMERILETLSTLEEGQALYVRHQRVPLHLLEALQTDNFAVHLCVKEEVDVRLFIHHI